MAELDTRMILQAAAPAPIRDLGDIMAQAEGIKAQKMRNALAQQEMDMRQGDMQAEKNFNALMDQAGGDYNKAMEMAGDWRTKQRIQGYIGEQQAAQAKNQAGQVETALKQLELGAQLMGGVSDQASYDNAKNQMRQFGMNVDTFPAEYNPQFVQQAQQSALSFKDRIAQQRADLEAQRVAQGDRRIEAMLARANQPQQTDPSKGWSIQETDKGLMRINSITGEKEMLDVNGEPLRGKQKTTAAVSEKPMPANIIKNQQEEAEIVKGTENINKTLDKYYDDIDKGKLKLGLGESAQAAIAEKTGYFSNDDTTALNNFKADITKMVNASLRLNKGVQTEGDAQRTAKEILENINDPQFVKERLQTLKGYNEAAAKAKKEVIDMTRAEYGKQPLFGQSQDSAQNTTAVNTNRKPLSAFGGGQ